MSACTRHWATEPQPPSTRVGPAAWNGLGKKYSIETSETNCFCSKNGLDDGVHFIARETAAIFSVLQRIIDGIDHLSWSAILDFENAQHPLVDRRAEIACWAQRAMANVGISEQVSARAQALSEMGFGALDAAYVASAEAAACDGLLTCADRLIRAARRVQLPVRVQNPVQSLEEPTHG